MPDTRTAAVALDPTALERFGVYAASVSKADLPADVIHAAKRCVIDWYATTLPGAIEAPATMLEKALADELDRGEATLMLGRKAAVRTAALINGTASHTVEFDDIYAPAIYHPGSPTIAAALAVGQARGASGDAFLRAVIAGYEVSTRIGAAMGRAHYKYWHNTGTIGPFGAAAAAGLLAGLDGRQQGHALATVATFAAGLQQAFRGDSLSKPLHAGHAADAGVLAALSAEHGLRGAPAILDAAGGMGEAMSNGPDWAAATADLGRTYNVKRITVKNHGCCGHAFAAIDGAMALQAQHKFAAVDIVSIDVGGYSATVDVTGNYLHGTPAAAKFSLPFLVASALVHGSIRLDAYTSQRLGDATVGALMKRIKVALDPEIDALFPRQRAARLKVKLADGRVLEHFQPHRVGDPDLPLSDRQLDTKFIELAVPVIGEVSAAKLLARLWALESEPDLAFTRILQ
ncbi:MmgE/PrpD family protein [Reyranella sp.]|uniref:MmgE/PrpD family protein n=1 Tax=Reyranella sp. TaxID=1929291 RepID=UPI00121FD2F3|nr:MmgE/PrpD family protein [Reyranella sp.]TAJ91030.1 MAG: MmgE/PrpD family protein [Reyranella sp.]